MDAIRNLISWWCDKAWLVCVYAIAVIASVVLIMNWNAFDTPEKIAWLLAIFIPAHVFEENTFPGGFFFMNNLTFGSKDPLAYPQNRATNMVTNLGAEIVFVLIAVNASALGPIAVTVAIFFGIVEFANHTREGIGMWTRFRSSGKKTIYAPGLATSCFLLLPLAVGGIAWLAANPFDWMQILAGVGICIGIAVCLILIPFAINLKVKSTEFAFQDAAYFSKYAERLGRQFGNTEIPRSR